MHTFTTLEIILLISGIAAFFLIAGIIIYALCFAAHRGDNHIEKFQSASDMKVANHTPRSELQRAALEFSATRRIGDDAWAIQDAADRLDNAAFNYVVTELSKAVHARK
jgi:hypothetical protein